MEYFQIWDLMSAQNFGGRKIFHTARLFKNIILDFRKISGNLGILHLQQLIFLKSTTKTIYICTYTINLWSQNNFLIDVATSLCKMVGVTFEPRDLSGNRMSPTLSTQVLCNRLFLEMHVVNYTKSECCCLS